MDAVESTALFHLMPVPGVLVDRHGMIMAANALAQRELNLPEDIASRPVSMLRVLADESRPEFFRALLRRPVGQSEVIPRLMVGPQASQEHRPTDVHFIRFPGEGSDFGLTLAALVDRSADSARESDRRLFQSVLDHAGPAISAFDADGRCLLANTAFAHRIGVDRDQVVGRDRAQLLAGRDLRDAQDADARVLANGEPEVTEERLFDGHRTRSIATSRFPMRDDDGERYAVGAVSTDITELRATELQLQLAMEVFARGTEAIVICDAQNRILSVNAAFCELTGYAEHEVLGRTPSVLRSDRHPDSFFADMWQALNTLNRWEGEMWSRRRDGSVFPHAIRLSRVLDSDGEVGHYIGIMSDITERREAEARIERLAFYDELTGAPTRRLLTDRMELAVQETRRGGPGFAVVFVDVDHFKEINDTMGHDAGDDLLRQVADRLRGVVRETDTVARFGGDEFVLLLRDVPVEVVAGRTESILGAFHQPFVVGAAPLSVSASIGVAHHPEDGDSPADLIKNADTAMYQAKSAGRRGWRFFNAGVNMTAHRQARLGMAMRSALDAGQFWLAYQPQVRLSDGLLTGIEVLLRWDNEELGNPEPEEFVPLAEESGQIVPITEWIMDTALHQMAAWCRRGFPRVRLAVNMAASHFSRPGLPDQVLGALARSQWPAALLELEITERLQMRWPGVTAQAVSELRGHGVRFALDDFGTGSSSLSYLRRLPIDMVKIDRSFVASIGQYYEDETVISSIVGLANILGKQCLAEGVETAAQAEFLRSVGCRHAQGFHFAAPMSADDLWAWHTRRLSAG